MNLVLSFISIVLIILSIPPIGINAIGWFALVPFFIMILNSENKLKDGFIFGCILGGVSYGFVILMFGRSILLKILSYILITVFQGLLFGVYGYVIGFLNKKVNKYLVQVIFISLFWSVLEFITNKLYFGFTTYIEMFQYHNYALFSLAKYIGMYGISFIIILINFSIANIFSHIERGNSLKSKFIFKNIGLIVMIIIVVGISSFNSFNFSNQGLKKKEKIKIGLIQGNIKTNEYEMTNKKVNWSQKMLNKYLALSRQSIKKNNSKLIVWPESAISRWLMRLPGYRDRIYNFADKNDIYLLFGSPDLNNKGNEYNSAFIISPEGKLVGRYNKTRLVPFMEDGFISGEKINNIDIEKMKIGVGICFEFLFPELSMELTSKKANAIFVLSNNGMFGSTIAPYFTSVFSVFRAVENNKYVAQVMNTGVSQIVTPKGRVINRTKIYEKNILNYELPIIESKPTFYSKYGEFVLWIISVLAIFYVVHLHFK